METDASFYDGICKDIHPYLNSYMEVLELACDSGQLSFNLPRHIKSWLGTDFSEQMIFLEARKRVENENLTFDVADATSLPSEDKKFDCGVIADAPPIAMGRAG